MDNLSISYLRWPVQEVMTFGFYQPLFKEVTLAGLNSLRHKECRISVENWIFDDPFRKRGQYWSFWCLRRSNHQDLEVFFYEIGLQRLQRPMRSMRLQRLLRPVKLLLRISDSSRVLNLALFGCFEKKIGRIMKCHVEFQHLFCRRLFRPDYVTF